MSNDLISRKALVKALLAEREHFPPMVEERYSFGVKLPHRFNQAIRGGIRKALRAVETAPAVDAEPVRHGRWVCKTMASLDDVYYCSVCGAEAIGYDGYNGFYYSVDSDYCPHCGATMDGGNEE